MLTHSIEIGQESDDQEGNGIEETYENQCQLGSQSLCRLVGFTHVVIRPDLDFQLMETWHVSLTILSDLGAFPIISWGLNRYGLLRTTDYVPDGSPS